MRAESAATGNRSTRWFHGVRYGGEQASAGAAARTARPSPGRGAGDRAGARGLADDGHAVGGLGEDAGTDGHGGLLGAAALAGAADGVGVDGLGDRVLHE